MNITDILNKVKTPEGDKLEKIFERQKELAEKYHPIEERNLGCKLAEYPVNLNICSHQQRIKDLMWRIVEELGEAGNCLKNKPWKNTNMATDELHFYEEIADAFHFFIELCIAVGLDAEKLTKLYFAKSEVNLFRIRSNY